jgi:hypothetical protein
VSVSTTNISSSPTNNRVGRIDLCDDNWSANIFYILYVIGEGCRKALRIAPGSTV